MSEFETQTHFKVDETSFNHISAYAMANNVTLGQALDALLLKGHQTVLDEALKPVEPASHLDTLAIKIEAIDERVGVLLEKLEVSKL